MGNVIKRNWNNKRLLKTQKEFPQLRKALSEKVILYLYQNEKTFMKSIYDITKFIARFDYPHTFQEFTQYVLNLC